MTRTLTANDSQLSHLLTLGVALLAHSLLFALVL